MHNVKREERDGEGITEHSNIEHIKHLIKSN